MSGSWDKTNGKLDYNPTPISWLLTDNHINQRDQFKEFSHHWNLNPWNNTRYSSNLLFYPSSPFPGTKRRKVRDQRKTNRRNLEGIPDLDCWMNESSSGSRRKDGKIRRSSEFRRSAGVEKSESSEVRHACIGSVEYRRCVWPRQQPPLPPPPGARGELNPPAITSRLAVVMWRKIKERWHDTPCPN